MESAIPLALTPNT